MDQNRKFAELAGLCWHEYYYSRDRWVCTGCETEIDDPFEPSNPDFSDPREVLKVVMEREDWDDFLIWSDGSCEPNCWITVDYITTPGKLRDAWIEWKESQTKGGIK
jgi:hypothetical protein